MLIPQEKHRLRQRMLALRLAMPPEEVRRRSAQIVRRLADASLMQQAPCVLTYLPFKNEVDIYPLINQLLNQGKAVYAPRSLSSRLLSWHRLGAREEIIRGPFGVPEPTGPSIPLEEIGNQAVALLPGLAFTRQGSRLGHGYGYYDRFLSVFAGSTIGLAYSFQVLQALPEEAHDRPVDEVISENIT